MKTAYIVKGYRTAVGKAPKGVFRFKRPDELAAETIEHMMNELPDFDKTRIDDVMVGNAMPEAEQGLNVGRLISLMGLKTDKVPGMTVNRYCSSGLETIALAQAKIEAGMADCIIAGGVESMSVMAMGGWRIVPNPKVGKENPTWYWGMGLTAEAVASQFNVSREACDAFTVRSHQLAIQAIEQGLFADTIVPVQVPGSSTTVKHDNTPRKNSNTEQLAGMRTIFSKSGVITAAGSSRFTDGSAALMVTSLQAATRLGLTPLAEVVDYQLSGVNSLEQEMLLGPAVSIPKLLARNGLTMNDIDVWELHEAFAAQVLVNIACMERPEFAAEYHGGKTPGELPIDKLNSWGGSLSLGNPFAATGIRLLTTAARRLQHEKKRYAVVSSCAGGGLGAAILLENTQH